MKNWLAEIEKIAAKTLLVQEEVPDEIAVDRLAVCLQCPHRIKAKDPDDEKCGVCGCYLTIKVKCKQNRSKERPNGELTHCPLGKWGDKEIANYYRRMDGKELLN